jgi:hypothetical protein
MKKLISTLAASIIAVSSMPVISASAFAYAGNDEISISTETLTEAAIADDGNVIPAGSVAITVSINGNTGFDSSTTKIDIGSANILVDNDGNPVYSAGEVLESSMIVSATNDNLVAFSTASAGMNNSDGDLFTFYATSDYDGAELIGSETEQFTGNITMPNSTLHSYIIGDVNQSGYIDATDASAILHAVYIYDQAFGDDVISVNYANAHLSTYFPNALVAESADGNLSDTITNKDAELVLTYYTHQSVGNPEPVAHVGELVYFISLD